MTPSQTRIINSLMREEGIQTLQLIHAKIKFLKSLPYTNP